MGWQTEDGKHEGWAAAEFPDGRLAVGSGTSLDGVSYVLARHLGGNRADHAGGEADKVDGLTAVGWRGACECGWRGPLWERVTEPPARAEALLDGTDGGRVDWAARKVFDPGLTAHGDASSSIEDSIFQEWRGHLPSLALADIREAAENVRKTDYRLAEAVARARADGCSWAEIGAASGITRQSAHERWSKR
jgi:hypothetical protein